MRKTHAAPSNLSLLKQCLLFGFFLVPVMAVGQAPDFGNDSSQWALDGECDDPRFQGSGMATTLLDQDRFSDATDCRLLFNQGHIALRNGDFNTFETSSGTGFFVSPNGHILTNHHVIDGLSLIHISEPTRPY